MADISKIKTPDNTEYDLKDANVPHSSLEQESGGTDLSLVTTNEKYKWNSRVRISSRDQYSTSDDPIVGYYYFPSNWRTTAGKSYLIDRIKCNVYERTVVFNGSITISAGNSSAAGAWTSVPGNWPNAIIVLDFWGYSWNGNDKTIWKHLSAQWSSSDSCIKVLNIRSVQAGIDGYTVRYCYFPLSS